MRRAHLTAIRIQFGAMSTLLAEIIDSALVGEDDFVVAKAEPGNCDGPIVVQTDCDVLLVCPQADRDQGVAVDSLAEGRPRSVLALVPHRESATIVRLTLETWPLVTSQDFCDAVRRAARPARRVAG